MEQILLHLFGDYITQTDWTDWLRKIAPPLADAGGG